MKQLKRLMVIVMCHFSQLMRGNITRLTNTVLYTVRRI